MIKHSIKHEIKFGLLAIGIKVKILVWTEEDMNWKRQKEDMNNGK